VQWSSLNYWHSVFSKKSNKEIIEIILLSLLQYSCSQDDRAGASLVDGCVYLKEAGVDIDKLCYGSSQFSQEAGFFKHDFYS